MDSSFPDITRWPRPPFVVTSSSERPHFALAMTGGHHPRGRVPNEVEPLFTVDSKWPARDEAAAEEGEIWDAVQKLIAGRSLSDENGD